MDLIFLELILVVVVALGLGLWQLWDINRELKKDREKARSDPHRAPPSQPTRAEADDRADRGD